MQEKKVQQGFEEGKLEEKVGACDQSNWLTRRVLYRARVSLQGMNLGGRYQIILLS